LAEEEYHSQTHAVEFFGFGLVGWDTTRSLQRLLCINISPVFPPPQPAEQRRAACLRRRPGREGHRLRRTSFNPTCVRHRAGSACPRDCTVYGKQCVSPPFIHSKSRMRKRARTALRGGRSAMVVPTATTGMIEEIRAWAALPSTAFPPTGPLARNNFRVHRRSGSIPFTLLASSSPFGACGVQSEKNVISLYMENC